LLRMKRKKIEFKHVGKGKPDLKERCMFDYTKIEKQSLDVLFLSSLFNINRDISRQTIENIGIEKYSSINALTRYDNKICKCTWHALGFRNQNLRHV
jgi:hypothetical protein